MTRSSTDIFTAAFLREIDVSADDARTGAFLVRVFSRFYWIIFVLDSVDVIPWFTSVSVYDVFMCLWLFVAEIVKMIGHRKDYNTVLITPFFYQTEGQLLS